MLTISTEEIYESLSIENPWWQTGASAKPIPSLPERSYLRGFQEIVFQTDVRRSVILMGPRRVGKTIMVLQTIDKLLHRGTPAQTILYISLDRPLYNGQSLESIVRNHISRHTENGSDARFYFFFDEIQYVRNWEQDLKSLTDLYPHFRFVASGSAAAALRVKSRESGAGRFTDFLLPPLTFDEFIRFQEEKGEQHARLSFYADEGFENHLKLNEIDIAYLNILFQRYLTYGGYPEAVLSRRVQQNLDRFVREDIIEKVLLRDLPSLYGISDTRELNSLFTTLSYNTAQEVSLEGISRSSAISKNTIKRYLEYLEAAFLIKPVMRIDQNARRFQRQTTFKIYLANPSLRAALFRPISQDDDMFGHMAETAVFSQWFHSPLHAPLHYARWDGGEVDLVNLDPGTQKPDWFVEVKWSDRHIGTSALWKPIAAFVAAHLPNLRQGIVTSRSQFARRSFGAFDVEVVPTAVYCWQVGRNSVSTKLDDQFELSFVSTKG